MLSMTKYPQEYVDDARAGVDRQIAAYRDLAKAAKGQTALETFEPLFFNNMVLALDQMFCHRARGQEGKDGNPLNEVRVLGTSLMSSGGVLTPDKTIMLKAETSVLGLEAGDQIMLSEDDFERLSNAFFEEIRQKFG